MAYGFSLRWGASYTETVDKKPGTGALAKQTREEACCVKQNASSSKKEAKRRQKGGAKMAKSWRNCKIIVGLASGNSFELLLTAK